MKTKKTETTDNRPARCPACGYEGIVHEMTEAAIAAAAPVTVTANTASPMGVPLVDGDFYALFGGDK